MSYNDYKVTRLVTNKETGKLVTYDYSYKSSTKFARVIQNEIERCKELFGQLLSEDFRNNNIEYAIYTLTRMDNNLTIVIERKD